MTSQEVKDKLDAEGVISGSSQVDYDNIQNQPTTISSTQASNITTNNNKVGYTDSLVKTKLNYRKLSGVEKVYYNLIMNGKIKNCKELFTYGTHRSIPPS